MICDSYCPICQIKVQESIDFKLFPYNHTVAAELRWVSMSNIKILAFSIDLPQPPLLDYYIHSFIHPLIFFLINYLLNVCVMD